jgi:hypothetical protein
MSDDTGDESAALSCPIPRMPNVKPLDPELQSRVDRGADPVETFQLGHAPDLYKKFLPYYNQMHFKGKVELRTKEVARLRIAELNQCHY